MSFIISAKVGEAERHLSEVTCLIFHQDKLYSGADDGKVKVWSPNLKLINEIDAHPVNVYSIAVGGDSLYTCSNDGTIKSWDLETLQLKKILLETPNDEIMRLLYCDGKLYSGDDKGKVLVWENDEQVGRYEVGEEVWGLMVSESFLFTVRNLDVSIIQMKPGGKQYTFLHSINGRSPLQKLGCYFCFMDRDGRTIYVHELSKESKFKAVSSLTGHSMIVNALCCLDEPHPTIFSGGYDKTVKRWDALTQTCTGSAELDTVINALAASGPGTVYVASVLGYIARVEFQ